MKEDARDPVDVLKKELQLLQSGHYDRLNSEHWRPALIFEDSPSCLNYKTPRERGHCDSCVLMQFVPADKRREGIPCRYIALDAEGETLDSLYRSCDMGEVCQVVVDWLRRTIADLESERAIYSQNECRFPTRAGNGPRAIPLYEPTEPKCANPECSSAFHWAVRGRLFRFPVGREQTLVGGIHHVRHYWLCESCHERFTLVGDAVCGAVLQPRSHQFST